LRQSDLAPATLMKFAAPLQRQQFDEVATRSDRPLWPVSDAATSVLAGTHYFPFGGPQKMGNWLRGLQIPADRT
jgi:hypothetical protein